MQQEETFQPTEGPNVATSTPLPAYTHPTGPRQEVNHRVEGYSEPTDMDFDLDSDIDVELLNQIEHEYYSSVGPPSSSSSHPQEPKATQKHLFNNPSSKVPHAMPSIIPKPAAILVDLTSSDSPTNIKPEHRLHNSTNSMAFPSMDHFTAVNPNVSAPFKPHQPRIQSQTSQSFVQVKSPMDLSSFPQSVNASQTQSSFIHPNNTSVLNLRGLLNLSRYSVFLIRDECKY